RLGACVPRNKARASGLPAVTDDSGQIRDAGGENPPEQVRRKRTSESLREQSSGNVRPAAREQFPEGTRVVINSTRHPLAAINPTRHPLAVTDPDDKQRPSA